MTVLRRRLDLKSASGRGFVGALVAAGLCLVTLGVATRIQAPSVALTVGGVAFLAALIWLFIEQRVELTLALVMAYLGLADGYVKLKTGSSSVTLGRDAMLYAVALGVLWRHCVRGRSLTLPPLGAWVIAFVAIVLVELANPQTASLRHGLAALRPHLEFVPLFFLGYVVMRTTKRLRAFLVLLLLIGAANGVVSYVQLNLTPEQLASWGPGYRDRIYGLTDVSGRTFLDSNGNNRTRPFGLGSDSGIGGYFGVLAVPAALALVALSGRRRALRLVVPLGLVAALAIVTSQGRTVLLAGLLAVAAYALLAATTRRFAPVALALVASVGITVVVISFVSNGSTQGTFDRYKTITPSNLLSTTDKDRGNALGLLPTYAVDYPLGGGLGSAGPAAAAAGGGRALNGETEFNFLVAELGVPGLLVVLGLYLRVMGLAIRGLRRVADGEARILLAALAAPIFAITLVWVSSSQPTSTSPTSPYFWFAAGTLAYWLASSSRAARPLPAAAPP